MPQMLKTANSNKRNGFPFKVGEVYVATLPDLKEIEVEDVLPHAQIVKLKGEGWFDCATLKAAVKARLGRAVYSVGLLSPQRRFIREA